MHILVQPQAKSDYSYIILYDITKIKTVYCHTM